MNSTTFTVPSPLVCVRVVFLAAMVVVVQMRAQSANEISASRDQTTSTSVAEVESEQSELVVCLADSERRFRQSLAAQTLTPEANIRRIDDFLLEQRGLQARVDSFTRESAAGLQSTELMRRPPRAHLAGREPSEVESMRAKIELINKINEMRGRKVSPKIQVRSIDQLLRQNSDLLLADWGVVPTLHGTNRSSAGLLEQTPEERIAEIRAAHPALVSPPTEFIHE